VTNVFLLPGEAKYVKQQTQLSTLFGSCVGVCLHDTRNKWGGLNHYMLPYQREGSLEARKFGDFAINALIRVACSVGSQKGDLVASIIGGGNVTGHLGSMASAGALDIGRRNTEVAREVLKEHAIRVVKEDVGGTQGRKVFMDTATNEVEIRLIAQSDDTRARTQRAQEFRQRKARVLIIDDSATVRRILRMGIELSDDMEVVGEAENPYEAREKLLELDPDVLCLDIIMPRLDGHSFLKKIMQYKPIPTVIVSTIAKRGSEMRRKVMEAGAVGVIDKEELELYKGLDVLKAKLLPELRKAAHATVTKR
jgi:chemotaxis receptor (MCP) glutamine deamidase CheD/CheY-like chemotaxis protein